MNIFSNFNLGISVFNGRIKARGAVARHNMPIADRGLVIVFHKVARVVFGAVFAGVCALRPKRAVKRIAVHVHGVHAQVERAGAAAHAALLGKRRVARLVNGGALALVRHGFINGAARGIEAAAGEPGLRPVAVLGGPVRLVVGANVLHARHRIGGQLLVVSLASGLQVRPAVAVIRFAHQRNRRFNDVVRRTHAHVFGVVQPRLNLVAVGIGRIAHLHVARVCHPLARLAFLRRHLQQRFIQFGHRIRGSG